MKLSKLASFLACAPLTKTEFTISDFIRMQDGNCPAMIQSVESWQSGGGLIIDIVTLKSGHVITITEDSVVVSENLEAFQDGCGELSYYGFYDNPEHMRDEDGFNMKDLEDLEASLKDK